MNLRILLTITILTATTLNALVGSSLGEQGVYEVADVADENANLLNANLGVLNRGVSVMEGAAGLGVAARMGRGFTVMGEAGLAGGAGLVLRGDSLSNAATNGLARGVSTQNYQLAPKYLTEKVVRKPKVITETVIQPVYERTINRPTLHRERYEVEPNLVQSEAVVRNRRNVSPVTQTASTLTKNVNVPGYTRFVQPVVQPTLLVRTETVDVRPSQAQVTRHAAQVMPVRRTNAVRTRNVNVPGATIHNRTYVQPILTRENVNVAVQRAQTRRVNHPAVTQEVVVQNRVNNKRVVVPGRKVFNQRIIQPQNVLEKVNVNLIKSQPTTETREAIIKPTIRRRNVQKKYHNVVYRVPVAREVQVVKPYYVRVNDLRTQFVPVDERGNALSAAAAASVLGTDGFAFNNDGAALNYADLRASGVNMGDAQAMDLQAAQAQVQDLAGQADAQAQDLAEQADAQDMNMGNWESAQADADAQDLNMGNWESAQADAQNLNLNMGNWNLGAASNAFNNLNAGNWGNGALLIGNSQQ